jgi:hypothetical protein
MEDPRPMEETSEDIFDGVSSIIKNTADVVNSIRRQAVKNIRRAEDLEDIGQQFREIAGLQIELAHRVAQLGAEAISADVLGEDDDDEEEWDEDEDVEDEQ